MEQYIGINVQMATIYSEGSRRPSEACTEFLDEDALSASHFAEGFTDRARRCLDAK
jgi:hypothetical protein